jgi:hypothetical protein
MSCKLATEKHLRVIVTRIAQVDRDSTTRARAPELPRTPEGALDCTALGQILLDANAVAFDIRYAKRPEPWQRSSVAYEHVDAHADTITVVKACDFLLYQLAESADWQRTRAARITSWALEVCMRAAIDEYAPGAYASAPWGIV